jgi:RHS repeat-associated protein
MIRQQYHNTAYYAFTPAEADILVASINFDNDTITSLAGQNSTYYGIPKGYASGDLVYTPNQYGDGGNDGEFKVGGTSYTPNVKVVARKYYAGVGMRENGTLNWLFSDHLGSTSKVVNADGSVKSEQRYKPWGGVRYTSGIIPTTYQFTGQRREESLGIYYYGARWYDQLLGRFLSADSIIPGAGNPQAWDRYAGLRHEVE